MGITVLLTNLGAGVWGGAAWYRRRPSVGFWYLLRCAQVAVVVQVGLGGLLVLEGREAARRPPLRLRGPADPRHPAGRGRSRRRLRARARGPRLRLAAPRAPARRGRRDLAPRDRDHGRLGAGDLRPRAAGGVHVAIGIGPTMHRIDLTGVRPRTSLGVLAAIAAVAITTALIYPAARGRAGRLDRRHLPDRRAADLDDLGSPARAAHGVALGALLQLLPHPADRPVVDLRRRELGRIRSSSSSRPRSPARSPSSHARGPRMPSCAAGRRTSRPSWLGCCSPVSRPTRRSATSRDASPKRWGSSGPSSLSMPIGRIAPMPSSSRWRSTASRTPFCSSRRPSAASSASSSSERVAPGARHAPRSCGRASAGSVPRPSRRRRSAAATSSRPPCCGPSRTTFGRR